jgi:hypothetical protein
MNGAFNHLVANERAKDMRHAAAQSYLATSARTTRPLPERPAPKSTITSRLRLRRPLETA